MVVDSTALPEHAVRDIVVSAFQSSGQRCSALRCLYVQEDIAESFLKLLIGAMDELELGDPWNINTDIGPIITKEAAQVINAYIDAAEKEGRLLHRLSIPEKGFFVPPSLIRISGIEMLEEEVFGPVLHVSTFKAAEIKHVIDAVNATGFGLTFGLHSRIDTRVQTVTEAVQVGNIYVNRNQIGAIVGSQPFGGEGLSGTGPKAGGPHYLMRFVRNPVPVEKLVPSNSADLEGLTRALKKKVVRTVAPLVEMLPGPTGELNRLSILPRTPLICAGPGPDAISAQRSAIEALGGICVEVDGVIPADVLTTLPEFGGIIWWGCKDVAREYALALAKRNGPIIPLITDQPDKAHACFERHFCADTTAAGGNAALLAGNHN
jgi:RHH-type proline utilization regulon transcriptional repressor/proline dehydrogenase/delta 1-pyrroline-5-carboxylate dehydrogenase